MQGNFCIKHLALLFEQENCWSFSKLNCIHKIFILYEQICTILTSYLRCEKGGALFSIAKLYLAISQGIIQEGRGPKTLLPILSALLLTNL